MKKKKSQKESVREVSPSNYRPKGPKTTVTARLSRELNNLPLAERAKYLESIARTKHTRTRNATD